MADKKPKVSKNKAKQLLSNLGCFKSGKVDTSLPYADISADIHKDMTNKMKHEAVNVNNNNVSEPNPVIDEEEDLFADFIEDESKAVTDQIAQLQAKIAETRAKTEAFRRSEEAKRREMERTTEARLSSCVEMKKKVSHLSEEYKKLGDAREDALAWYFSYEEMFKAFKVDIRKGVCAEGKPVITSGPAGFYSKDKLCCVFECPVLKDQPNKSE